MEKNNLHENYVAPVVHMFSIKPDSVVCTSGYENSIEVYDEGTWNW